MDNEIFNDLCELGRKFKLLTVSNHGYKKGIQKAKKESSFEADYYQSKEMIQ
jgi:hypothetical protein